MRITSADPARRSGLFSYENGILLLLGFSFGLVFFDRNTINYLAAAIQTDLGLTNAQIGMLSSGLALAWALSAYFVSAWSDLLRARKPFVLLSIVVFSLCSAVSGLATSFAFLLAARVLMGIAEGPFLPVCLSIMNVESSPHRRGLNAGIMQNVFAALMGTLLAGFLVPRLAEAFDWRATFFLTGIPGLVCALLVLLYLREPARAPEEAHAAPPRIGSSAIEMLRAHNIRICCIISIFMVAWFLVGLAFLPLFFQSYRGFTAEQAGALVGVTGLATMICGFLVPAWSDRVGRKPAMIVFCFLGIVTPLAALWFDGPMWMLSVLLFVGWSGTGAFPIFMGVVPGETVSRSLAASSMGLVVCVGELVGGVSMPTVAGWIADQTSLAAPIIVAAACALCAGVAALFLEETAPRKVGAAIPVAEAA
ncbi:MAG TPA: MFS transporter [Gammaproteobacteria bacterium]